MRRFEICVRPAVAALALGGQSGPQRGGDKATARDHRGRLVIPASALRGALRIELERLLLGRDGGDAKACSANRAEQANPEAPCDCPVCRLFGESGTALGTLRIEDGHLDESLGPQPTIVRSRVAVSRRTRTAADRLLSFAETSDLLGKEQVFRAPARLVPRGPLDSQENLEADYGNLRAACAALRAIGGGRARGFGWVDCSIEDRAESEPQAEGRVQHGAGVLELSFEALAPLHFGQGRQIAFFQPSLKYAPGSAVRGAVAFALLEEGHCTPDDAGFQELFGATTEVTFGSARPPGDVPSATRRKCRSGEHIFDDLVGEILRREAALRGLALAQRTGAACPVAGCTAEKVLAWRYRTAALRPLARVRTRTALNRLTGTSMDRKLYSVEAIEPEVTESAGAEKKRLPLVLTARVSGLGTAGARLLGRLDGREVWLGGKRSKGMGRCRLRLSSAVATEPEAMATIDALASAFDEGWVALRQAAGKRLPERWLGKEEVPVALVLTEPWCPAAGEGDLRAGLAVGPLLARAEEAKDARLLSAFVEITEEGRYGANEARRYGATVESSGEVPPLEAAAAGSTYVYAVPREVAERRLEEWLGLGLRGQGLHREIGWGRFTVRGPDSGF